MRSCRHALVLQAAVARVEESIAFLERGGEFLVIPQPGQPLFERAAGGDFFEEAKRDFVLGLDPRACFLGVGVLERPKRVGNLRAVVLLDHVGLGALGIGTRSGLGDFGNAQSCQRDRHRGRDNNGENTSISHKVHSSFQACGKTTPAALV